MRLVSDDGNVLAIFSDGAASVRLTGSNVQDSEAIPTRTAGLSESPTINTITITAAEVELKAGISALAGRKQMIVYPPAAGSIYWGATGLTSTTGAELKSTDSPLTFDLDPNNAVHLYAINDGTNRDVKVVEAK